MVVTDVASSLILVAGWYFSSFFSAFYIFAGIYIKLKQLCGQGFSEMLVTCFYYSLFAIISKIVIFLYLLNEETKKFLDFVAPIDEIKGKFWVYLVVDVLVGVFCVLGKFYDYNIKRFKKLMVIISMIFLALCSISLMTVSNLMYVLFFILYLFGLVFESTFLKRVIPRLIVLLSTFQLIFPFFSRCFTIPVAGISLYKFGLLEFKDWNIVDLISLPLLVLVNSLFSFIMVNYHKPYNISLKEKFLHKHNSTPNKPNQETVLNIKYLITYSLACFMLWLWIIIYKGPSGLIIMSWVFISVLNTSHKFLKSLTIFILIPTLLVSFILNFIYSVFNLENTILSRLAYKFNSPIIETLFALITILNISATVYYSKDVSSLLYFPGVWYGRIFANLFKRIYLFSLIVLFLIGLSDINFLHFGLMVICLFFMTNPNNIKKFWIWLLGYNMAMLYIRYIYFIVHPYISWIIEDYHLTWFGLKEPESDSELSYIPYDYLIWILFASVSLQHKANYINVEEGKQDKENFVFKTFHTIRDFIIKIEIYVLYIILITIIFVSKANFLNYFRIFIIVFIFLRHLSSTSKPILINFKDTYALFVLLEAYSALLLTSRYFYQFQTYTGLKIDFPLTGYEVYEDDKKEWYTDTASDWAIFIISVLASRNCKERANIERRKSIKPNKSDFFTHFVKPFHYILFLFIYFSAIYGKLGVFMLIFVLLIGFYAMYMAFYFMMFGKRELNKSALHELQIRSYLFKALFFITLLCMVIGYFRFLVVKKNVIFRDWFEILDWGLFIFGFTKQTEDALPIMETYPYLAILIFCVIERNCIEHLKLWHKIKETSKKLKKSLNPMNDGIDVLKKKLSNCQVKVFLKSIAESLIPMFLMLLAFDKISIISVVYIMAVFISSCSPDLTISGLLFTILIFMVDVQYTLILSNINSTTAGFIPNSEKPLQIPWFDYENWPNSDKARFLNMGTDLSQLQNLIYDMISLIGVLMYYNYLSGSEREKEDLIKKLQNLNMEKLENEENEEDKSMLKIALEQLKHYFYIFSRLLVTAILLLFVTQGQGLVSMPYCIFCMIFIYKESSVMKSDKFRSYTDLLSWFLKYIIIDLTSQILVQIPFLIIADEELSEILYYLFLDNTELVHKQYFRANFYKWCNYIGLMKIWKASEEEIVKGYLTILSKVYCFTFLFMIYRMMKSKDYIMFNQERFKGIESKASVISVKMSQHFNDERIKTNKFYAGSKDRFHKELKKLEDKLKKLNKVKTEYPRDHHHLSHSKSVIQGIEIMDPIDFSEKIEIGKKNELNSTKIGYSFTSRMLDYIVCGVNVYLFDDFIDKITPFGRLSAEKNSLSFKEKLKNKKKFYKSLISVNDENENSDSSGGEEVNLNESYEKEVIEYDFVWTHYPKLILYFLASQTEAIVYCVFFINHFKYASLESVIYPLSVVGYALLEYPRAKSKYFQFMMIYTQFVIVFKFFIQIDLIIEIIGKERMQNYNDPLKIGFNIAANTYSQTIFYYILWDVAAIITLLLHQQYLYRVGLQKLTEKEIETLDQAKIRNNLQVTSTNDPQTHFFSSLLLLSKQEKPGKDWYTQTIFIQITILVYIFFFFSKLDGNSINIQQSFRNNQFQGRMVSAVIVQMALTLIDRYFYIKQTTDAFMRSIPNKVAIYFRVVVHLGLTLVIHILCFWYFPINGNFNAMGSPQCEAKDKYGTERCNNFEINKYLEYFYCLYFIYLIFSALQIKYGMPSFKRSAFPLTRIVSPISLGLFKTYRSVPFFFELRTLIDWVTTNTSLTIFQWFKFEDINSQLFINKCTQRSLEMKKKGESIPLIEKCYMGVFSILIILIVILAPLIVFSTMNPIIEYNRVQSVSLKINLMFNDREFEVYKITTAEEIHDISENEWQSFKFYQIPELVSTDLDIMQKISMPSDSDYMWPISTPGLKRLCKFLTGQNISFGINNLYQFKRNFPETRRKVELERFTKIDDPWIVEQLYEVICEDSQETVLIPGVFNQLIRLPSNVNSINPTIIEDQNFNSPLVLTFNSDDNYWRAETMDLTTNETINVRFFTLSDRFSKITLNYSVNSMFVSVVLAIGLTIKLLSRGSAYYLGFSEMKRTDYLETLCAGVYVSRMIGDIEKEEELYYELIDILRSTETTKMITGNQSISKAKTE